MSSIDHLHSETKMLLVENHLSLLSAQYLVYCLDTEIVCHHITTLDHPPREMKESLFTTHKQTVLPLLANTKKASLQAVHTSFVNTEIDNMTYNRVLNYRPPFQSRLDDCLVGNHECLLLFTASSFLLR